MKKIFCGFAVLCIVAGVLSAETFPVINGYPGATVVVTASALNGSVTNLAGASVLNATNVVGLTLKTNTLIYCGGTTNVTTNTVIYLGK